MEVSPDNHGHLLGVPEALDQHRTSGDLTFIKGTGPCLLSRGLPGRANWGTG